MKQTWTSIALQSMALAALTTACQQPTNDQPSKHAQALTLPAPQPGEPQDSSCVDYYADKPTSAAKRWCLNGDTFVWQAHDSDGNARSVNIFWLCDGDPANPAIYLNHGWPTSSFDFADLFEELNDDFYLCALDTTGYGFSDKPHDFDYTVSDDGALVEHFVTHVANLNSFTLLTHDKGDTVGLELLRRYQQYGPGQASYQITAHIMLNGSIHLDQANLSQFQLALLDDVSGPPLAEALNGHSMAALLGASTYSPALDVAERYALASVFDYQDGTSVLHDTIQYLDERAAYEEDWLDALADSDVPTTLIWGELDGIAVNEVADYVWQKKLAYRSAAARYYRLPQGNHYVEHDKPADVATIVQHELLGTPLVFDAAGSDSSFLCADNQAADPLGCSTAGDWP